MNPATDLDVESRWRPLSLAESFIVGTRLEDAWRELRRRIPDLESRIASDDDLRDDAARVLADAVIRVMKNPDGHRKGSVSVDDASRTWELDDNRSSGELYFTAAELDLLGSVTGYSAQAFSVMPT